MTTIERKLAAIEALPEGTYRDTKGIGWHGTVVGPSELEWLIAEVRRLTEDNTDIHSCREAISEHEYARGRADELKAVLAMIKDRFACSGYDIKRVIERGEHVAEVKDGK